MLCRNFGDENVYVLGRNKFFMLGLNNLSDGLLSAAEKVDELNNKLTAKKNAVKEAVAEKISDAEDAVHDAKDAVSDRINDAKETVIETKDNVATAVKDAARNSLKKTVQEINKNL